MIDKKFYKMMLSISLPIALQNIISYSVNMMDTIMLGSLGEIALSASSLANQVFFIFTVACFGIAGGAVVLCSQYWGKQDVESIQKVTTIALKITIAVSIIFTVVILLFPSNIISIFTNEQEVIDAGAGYLRMVSLSYLFYGITSTFLVILRSVETVKISVLIYGLSFFINVFFNYMFIFGKFGAPEMGVTGAAVGTVIARVTEFFIMLIFVLKIDKKVNYRIRMLKLHDKELLKDIIHYGLPVMINELLWSIGISVHSVILGHMGSNIVAANSICNVVYQMATSLILGIGNAAAVIIGKVIGEEQYDYAKQCVKRLIRIFFFVGIFSAIILIALKDPIIAIYKIQEETKLIAEQLMIAYAVAIFFMSYTCPIIMGIFRGSGDTKFAMVTDVGCLWLAIPIGAVAAFVFHLPPLVVFACLKLDMPLKAVVCLLRLKGDSWIRNVTRS